ncbi:hypothetical protein ACTHT5_11395, partial [Neisseria sp. P0022.S002]|uniref:hypothetical protein n=1 Tax=Neisseria sp. P0022.S002 TaxID=3436827 RepID=UPI003F7DAE7F
MVFWVVVFGVCWLVLIIVVGVVFLVVGVVLVFGFCCCWVGVVSCFWGVGVVWFLWLRVCWGCCGVVVWVVVVVLVVVGCGVFFGGFLGDCRGCGFVVGGVFWLGVGGGGGG